MLGIVLGSCLCLAAKGKPNVVLIVSEDHALSSFGAYQGRFAELKPTPELDKLASGGTLFMQAFCSNAMPAPGMATLLTGKMSHANGVLEEGDKFNGSQPSLPKLLQEAGYSTALFGKWGLGTEPEGFDHWEILADENEFYNPLFWSPTGKTRFEGYATDVITDLCLQWMQARKTDEKPFFMMIQFNASRQPWMPAIRHVSLYDDVLLPEPENLFDDLKRRAPPSRYQEMEIGNNLDLFYDLFSPKPDGWKPAEALSSNLVAQKNVLRMNEEQSSAWRLAWRPQNEALGRESLDLESLVRWKYQRFAKNYLRCLKGIDENVGRILSSLAPTDGSQNLIAYTANHGRFVGEHGWFGTHWMYEESMKIPLILYGTTLAGPARKIVKSSLAQDIDVAPTLLSALRVPVPQAMNGKSLLPLLERNASSDEQNASAPWRSALYFHHHSFPEEQMVPRHYGVRTASLKLIHYYQFDEWELFDLAKDPEESLNLYENEAYQKRISGLRTQLSALKNQYSDGTDPSVMPEEWRRIFRGPDARKNDQENAP